MGASVLVIEDDAAVRHGLCAALELGGHRPLPACSAEEGLDLLGRQPAALVLLDLVLPGRDGLAALPILRVYRPGVPVIILTARGDEATRLKGFALGADDFVVKPFSVHEVLARVAAVLRRCGDGQPAEKLHLPHAAVCLETGAVQFGGGAAGAALSEKERDLLRCLVRHRGRAVSREALLREVWGLEPAGLATRTVDMHLARLRDKLRLSGPHAAVIRTVRGQGYLYDPPTTLAAPNGQPQ